MAKKANDGDLLERVVAQLCKAYKGAKVEKNVKITGKSGRKRQIDVLITGKIGPFTVKINVEAKNHKRKVGIAKVDEVLGKLEDTGLDIGVIVSSAGFDAGAKAAAVSSKIQLVEPLTPELPNLEKFFIPIRAVIAEIENFQIGFKRKASGPFSISHTYNILAEINGEKLNLKQVLYHCWNTRKIPQKAGAHELTLGATKIFDITKPGHEQYCDLFFTVNVIEKYYLGILPAIGLRNITGGKESNAYQLDLHIDKIESEWKKYVTFEELTKAANSVKNQIDDVTDLLVHPESVFSLEGVTFP